MRFTIDIDYAPEKMEASRPAHGGALALCLP